MKHSEVFPVNKVKQNLLIFILIAVAVALGIYIALINARSDSDGICLKQSVPNADAAVSIAQLICRSYTGMDVEDEAFVPEYDTEKDVWKVRLKSERDFDSTYSSWFEREHAIYIEGGDATVLKASINTRAIKEYYETKALYEP